MFKKMSNLSGSVRTRRLRSNDWVNIERLFGENGACGGCWCMYWRAPSTGKYWETHKGAKNRATFKKLVETGEAKGVLAFSGQTPIGWCSVGLRSDFAYFERARKIPPLVDDKTWSVTCFFVQRSFRNNGVADALLQAAINYGRARKGAFIEGYPAKPRQADTKIPDAFAHTGVPSLFEKAGFSKVTEIGARSIYRMPL